MQPEGLAGPPSDVLLSAAKNLLFQASAFQGILAEHPDGEDEAFFEMAGTNWRAGSPTAALLIAKRIADPIRDARDYGLWEA